MTWLSLGSIGASHAVVDDLLERGGGCTIGLDLTQDVWGEGLRLIARREIAHAGAHLRCRHDGPEPRQPRKARAKHRRARPHFYRPGTLYAAALRAGQFLVGTAFPGANDRRTHPRVHAVLRYCLPTCPVSSGPARCT